MSATEEDELLEAAGGDSPLDRTIPVRRFVLAGALLVLNVLDVVSTKWIISLGGEEANPLMKPIIDDPAAPLLVKGLLALLIGVCLLASPRESRVVDRAMLFVVVIYTCVIGWNAGVLAQGLRFAG